MADAAIAAVTKNPNSKYYDLDAVELSMSYNDNFKGLDDVEKDLLLGNETFQEGVASLERSEGYIESIKDQTYKISENRAKD
jgi:hypothetical protein